MLEDLPQFVPAGAASPRTAFFVLGLVFAAMTLVAFTGYGLLAARVRDHVVTRPRAMTAIRWGFTAAFLLLGLRLGWETFRTFLAHPALAGASVQYLAT